MRPALLCLLALAVTGCVSKSRYNALRTDYDVLLGETAAMAESLAVCEASAAETREALVACESDWQGEGMDESDWQGEGMDEPMDDAVPTRGPAGNRKRK